MNSILNLWETNRPLCVLIGVLIVVLPFLLFYLNKARKEHPKGLIAAALSNMGERFGYYIMNAVLVLFICSKFGISDEVSGIMFAVFYFLIYVLALPGGIIADRTQNYKSTIIWGIIVMALGYAILSIPVFSDHGGFSWVLVITMLALVLIACGNGLFKGNLQAIVGQLYDDFEAEAAKKGPEALAQAKEKRDSGFQIFYVFINIGGVIAPFIAPLIRNWWLQTKNLVYNADLPRLCHKFVQGTTEGNDMENLTNLTQQFPMQPPTWVDSATTTYRSTIPVSTSPLSPQCWPCSSRSSSSSVLKTVCPTPLKKPVPRPKTTPPKSVRPTPRRSSSACMLSMPCSA